MEISNLGAKRIALFDSGLGGLSVLRKLLARFVERKLSADFIYFADTGRCPYGNRPAEDVRTFVKEITAYLNSRQADILIMACNTSAAVAKDIALATAQGQVLDLISASSAFAASRYKKIAVLATATTARSKAFSQAIQKENPQAEVLELACPDLVPLVESGVLTGNMVKETISPYCMEISRFQADAVIFGCTHFPFLEQAFREVLGNSLSYIDPADTVLFSPFAGNGKSAISDKANLSEAFSKVSFATTGDSESFARLAELCLEQESGSLSHSVSQVKIEDLVLLVQFNGQITEPGLRGLRSTGSLS